MIRGAALLLTVLTGFSGLVYEVAWQRYLATLLGSHSESTAAVLGIFLGGLAVGYGLFGAVTRRLVARSRDQGRPPPLLWLYGWVEIGIGVYALLFPWLFQGVQALSFWIPHGAAGPGFALDVALATLLVLPPTVLMGGTIPILTQALSRSLEDATRFHAFVYAFNTVGAFAGALAAGFYLIPTLGLRGVMLTVCAINLGAGSLFLALGWRARGGTALPHEAGPAPEGFTSYAIVALLVGFAMMAIQTVLIRLGGLSFGSSEFTFAMVVAVFVLCIALGSFAVSAFSRVPPLALLVNQWALVGVLLLLYGRLEETPYWAHVLRTLFRDTDLAFYPYYAAAFLAALVAVGPAVVLSGATLPLLFHHLRREVGSLGALAGRIYGWNTVGSLLGALLGGYALLFWLDLHAVYRVAVAALIGAAVILTVRIQKLGAVAATAVLLPMLGALLLLAPWEPSLLSSGLFRSREPSAGTLAGPEAVVRERNERLILRHYEDDPTSSVSVVEIREGIGAGSLSIVTNGKPDGNTHFDYPTMALAALLPALFAEKAESAFVIGLGTGVTAGELAALPSMRRVVVAEISPGVLRAAPLFDFANLEVTEQPAIEMVRSDAYRALMRSDERFDVIVSEPSNPWVTGVENLFSREFLEAARSRLAPGGVYLQWYHQYETDEESLSLVLRTYAAVFEQVAVWYGGGADLLLLGFEDPRAAFELERLERRAGRPAFAEALARSGVNGFPALLAHEILPAGVVRAAQLQGPVHTLQHPRLSHRTGRAFFRGERGELPFTGWGEPARVGARNSLLARYAQRSGGRLTERVLREVVTEACKYRVAECSALAAYWHSQRPDAANLQRLLTWAERPGLRFGGGVRRGVVAELAAFFPPPGAARATQPIGPERARRATALFRSFYHHAVPFRRQSLLGLWRRCRAGSDGAGACEEGRSQARALVTAGIVPDEDA